jgi:hypothetical protein
MCAQLGSFLFLCVSCVSMCDMRHVSPSVFNCIDSVLVLVTVCLTGGLRVLYASAHVCTDFAEWAAYPQVLAKAFSMFEEISRVLCPRGIYVCVSLCEQYILNTLLQYFHTNTYAITFEIVHPAKGMNVTMRSCSTSIRT